MYFFFISTLHIGIGKISRAPGGHVFSIDQNSLHNHRGRVSKGQFLANNFQINGQKTPENQKGSL